MSLNTQAEKISLLLNVIEDPVGAVPMVREVVEEVAKPRKQKQAVLYNNMYFSSITDLAHYLCYADPGDWHDYLWYDRYNRDITKIKTAFVGLVRREIKKYFDSYSCVTPLTDENVEEFEMCKKHGLDFYDGSTKIKDMSDYKGRWI